jgi:hypothetical protein
MESILIDYGLININGDQNIRQKRIPLRTRSFLSLVVHLKEFGPNENLLCTLNYDFFLLSHLFNKSNSLEAHFSNFSSP